MRPAGVLVGSVPPGLWGGSTISDSKMAIAVDPSNPANVALGGTHDTPDAALFLGAVTCPAAGPLTYTAPAAHRGEGVHVDMLAIRFTNDGSQVWVACDGGVFVSTASGQEGTFVARNTGLAVIEAGFVACHPTNDAALVLGAQDNATQRRVGETIWRFEQGGDGGGVAFDQVVTHRYVAQQHATPTGPTVPTRRGRRPARQGQLSSKEDDASGVLLDAGDDRERRGSTSSRSGPTGSGSRATGARTGSRCRTG